MEVAAHVSDAVIVLHPYTKSDVRRLSSSDDMTRFGHGVNRSGDLDLSTLKWGHSRVTRRKR